MQLDSERCWKIYSTHIRRRLGNLRIQQYRKVERSQFYEPRLHPSFSALRTYFAPPPSLTNATSQTDHNIPEVWYQSHRDLNDSLRHSPCLVVLSKLINLLLTSSDSCYYKDNSFRELMHNAPRRKFRNKRLDPRNCFPGIPSLPASKCAIGMMIILLRYMFAVGFGHA
ncbi:hypothetical protein BDZ45DRAFT_102784 [Acephala macrosclerotiorum]|nr:hypothetical protein BDZ45DRAFT_102784 [Acephala macrosclerotiorum]